MEYAEKKQNQSNRKKSRLPDRLKSGIENLSGYSMDDVNVHYNSSKPGQMQAHAYAQGSDIHIASGQEKHLPHEAWHVVQQKQGRVQATTQMKRGVNVNDDAGLEKEADIMGEKALRNISAPRISAERTPVSAAPIAQMKLEDAQTEAKAQGFEAELSDKAAVLAYLRTQTEPAPTEGVDKIRRAFNKGLKPGEWIKWLEAWPEQEAPEIGLAREWVAKFLAKKGFNADFAEKNGYKEAAETIKKIGGFRIGEGIDMLNKFIFYNSCAIEILTHLIENWSPAYKNALEDEFSAQLSINSGAAVSDEVFKGIPSDADAAGLQAFGAEAFVEPLQAGINNFTASLEDSEMPRQDAILEYYFLHDKGYLNATAPLNTATYNSYVKRIDDAAAAQEEEKPVDAKKK